MMEIQFALKSFLPALGLAAFLMPLARRLALAVNLVAGVRPDRLHREPKPYGGGLGIAAVLLIFGVSMWLALTARIGTEDTALLAPGGVGEPEVKARVLAQLGFGAVLYFIIGLVDDRYRLSAAPKLTLQFVAAALVVSLGIKATAWVPAAMVPEIISVLWIVAVVNAYNLFDHADGLAAAAGVVALVALAIGQMAMGAWFVAGLAFITAGAIAGFLFYNWPPARLFLGDAGSSLIGYLLAALMMVARYYFPDRGTSPYVVLVPLALLAVPLFDMVCVILSRLRRRRNPLVGDATSHLAHRMLARGARPRATVLFAAGACAATGAASVGMYFLRGPLLVGMWLLVAAALVTVIRARRPPQAEAPP